MKYSKVKTSLQRAKLSGDEHYEEFSTAPLGFEVDKAPTDLVFYFYDPIGPEVDYVDFIHTLRTAPEGRDIYMHINSPGGHLNSCLAIINAMEESRANIITIVDGEASSAAALIWLAGHEKRIASKHTCVMLHGASVGYHPQKTSDIANTNAVTIRMVEALLDDLAEGLLNQQEREDIRKGVDVYLTGEDIMARVGQDHNPEDVEIEMLLESDDDSTQT